MTGPIGIHTLTYDIWAVIFQVQQSCKHLTAAASA